MRRTRILNRKGTVLCMAKYASAFAVFCLLIAAFALNQMSGADLLFAASTMGQVAQGRLSGVPPFHPNTADLSAVQPGDVILCHNSLGSYGYWTHAVLYVGNGQAIDACDFVLGTAFAPLEKYHGYGQVLILRPRLPEVERQAVAETGRKEVGKPYDPYAPLSETTSQYCTKLIWQVFRQHGLWVCSAKRWIVPDDFAKSPDFTHIVPHSRTTVARVPTSTSLYKRRAAVC